MILVRCLLVAVLLMDVATAQQVFDPKRTRTGHDISYGSRSAVATHPSNNPFVNPFGKGVPPAVSARGYQNSNRTNVPLDRAN